MTLEPEEMALEFLNALDTGHQIRPFTDVDPDLTIADAYRVADAIRSQRRDRGERHVGRKIGFTNRTIWPIYGVDAPIWGDMWDRTVFDADTVSDFSLDGLLEPRLEPELVLSLARVPEPGMTDDDVLACCDWIAHGAEIVQSPFPGWVFKTPDTICAGGLHGALLVGPRIDASDVSPADLGTFECALSRDGSVVETGRGSNVLGSPVRALSHLVGLLADDPLAPPLSPGEIITTGTVTDAYPLMPAERWTTHITGLPLAGLDLSFV